MMHESVMQQLVVKAQTDEVAAFALAYIQKLESERCNTCHEVSCYGCENKIDWGDRQ